ncbi:MAG: hypothetical protein ACKE51_07090 [Methylococcaceae bacterium]
MAFKSLTLMLIASYDLIAPLQISSQNTDLSVYFNPTVAPKLEMIALQENNTSQQLAFISARSKANTQESIATLQRIGTQSNNTIIIRASKSAVSHFDNLRVSKRFP